MKVASANNVKVYTVSGEAVRNLPDWLVRQKKRALRDDPGESHASQNLQQTSARESNSSKTLNFPKPATESKYPKMETMLSQQVHSFCKNLNFRDL